MFCSSLIARSEFMQRNNRSRHSESRVSVPVYSHLELMRPQLISSDSFIKMENIKINSFDVSS